MANTSTVAVVQDATLTPAALLGLALDRAGFWPALEARRAEAGLAADAFHVLIKPDLGAFAASSPTATSPALVEALLELLHDAGYVRADVCAAADSSFLWAENRDVAVLADLLGYRYATPKGRGYDVIDLSQDLVPGAFAPGAVLHGGNIARAWRDAPFRIVFASNKTDEHDAYALCLSGLLGVLPLIDKDYHYRHRVAAGDAVTELLQALPVQFALIDATTSAHGGGGSRAPQAIATHCIIASHSVLLADYAGALKMGADPHASRLADRAFRAIGLPAPYAVHGDLAPYAGWRNVHPLLADSNRKRDASTTLARLLTPWLQVLDADLFPLKHPLDAKANAVLSPVFAEVDAEPAAFWALVLTNYGLGSLHQGAEAWRVMFDKDALRRVHVPLGLDLAKLADADFHAIVPELLQLEPLLAGVPEVADGLRWRYVDKAVLFEFQRELPIGFDEFTRHVDVASTIQFMNDYIGGVVVPVRRDAQGRVVLQAERNLYLPQPNYLALSQGQAIDVTKLEVSDYADGQHRMFWKTIKSENGSAVCDDGVVSFARTLRGTQVSIVGRQLFTLPPFWQALDLDLNPELKNALVTHAYETFFNRTCANFEARVEGRDIFIGRAWHAAESPLGTEALPIEGLQRQAMQWGERLQALLPAADATALIESASVVDADGFEHFKPGPSALVATPAASPTASVLKAAFEQVTEFYAGLARAVARDAARAPL